MTINQTTEDILSRLNLDGPLPQQFYVEQVEGLGKDGVKFLDAMDDALEVGFTPERWKKIYKLKNINKKLSHIVSSHSYAPNYRGMLDWLQENYHDKPSTIIELGCDNGLFTQCLQLLYKEAQVVGIDVVKEAILIAKKLAYDNRLQTVSFDQENLLRPIKLNQKFDLVVAPFIFHELLDADDSSKAHLLENLKKLSNSDTKIIAFNRFPESNMQYTLNQNMETAGFELTKHDQLSVANETFPVSVYQLVNVD